MNILGINGNEPFEKKLEQNDSDDAFGKHVLMIKFLVDSYLFEEVEMMTIDTLLANVAGLLGLLCGFELAMVARFFFDYGCFLVTRFFYACFHLKRPLVASGPFGLKRVDAEVGSNPMSGKSPTICELSVKA